MKRTRQQKRWLDKYGPWAVVTGASEGIGRETARVLAAAGLNLVLVARREAVLREFATELASDHGIRAQVVAVDLGSQDGWRTVVDATRSTDVGLLVASAGFGTSGPLIDADLGNELDMVDVNCRGLLALTQQYGRRFANRGRGGLVLLSSLVGFQGTPYAANYAATKAYVLTLAEGLRAELAPRGVDVVASAPGPVHSGFAVRADMEMGLALRPDQVAEKTLRALGARSIVRPGWLSKLLGWSLATLPRFARVRIMKLVMGGMTQHQRRGLPAGESL